MPRGARQPKVRVASTGTKPELVDTIPIARAAQPTNARTVVLSLGPDSDTDLPLPQRLKPGDRLAIYLELELTTDYRIQSPGSMGTPYTYDPWVQAVILLAADGQATAHEEGRAHSIRRTAPVQVTHDLHHLVLVVDGADAQYTVPPGGPPWSGPVYVNVALAAAHPNAAADNKLLIGENEPDARVDQDTGGLRAVRFRPGTQPAVSPKREARLRRRAGVPVTKTKTVIFSKELRGLKRGEQLFVRGKVRTDAARTGYKTRISTRMVLADRKRDTEPATGGHAKAIASWNGHLSKENGFNCLLGRGPQTTRKYGVLRINQDATQPLFVNLVATCAAPDNNPPETGDDLPVEADSFIEITRYPPQFDG
jgi:hypothetical protein